MNIPQTIAFSTSATTAFFFLPNVLQPTLVKNIIVHNTHSGTQSVHLTYKVGYSDTVGVGTAYDFYAETLASNGSMIFNELIICNPGDSVGVYGAGNIINVIANVLPL